MSEPEKWSGESLDVAAAKRAELKQLFPGAVTETLNEHGELVASVDFVRLKAELGEFTDLFEGRRERYGMEWPGKGDALKVIQEKAQAAEGELKLDGENEKATPQDLGFRVLKLNKSNFKAWQPLPADAGEAEIKEALQGHLFHVDETATPEDILFEILLKAGELPSTEIKTLILAGKTVYSVAEGSLFICLEDEITRELINAVVEKLPQQFICLDRGFKGNDQLKANMVQTFNALNEAKDKDSKITFRTV